MHTPESESEEQGEGERDAYRRKAEKTRESYEKRKAAASDAKGLLVVFTGPGKGKSTAAFGMLARALQHGMNAGVVQFVKGQIASAETDFFARLGAQVEWHRMGQGFSWITQDEDVDRRAAQAAWERSLELLTRPELGMVVLDELCVALRRRQLELEPVLAALAARRADLHVVVTGRGAPDELVELADLVTEMKLVKHPYRAGIRAQPGIEF